MKPVARAAILAVALISVAFLGGCGDDADEQGTSGDLGSGEVQIDDDTVRYRSDDGDAVFELEDQGKVRVSTDEGETVLTHGDAAVLPDDWPQALVLPDTLKLTSASAMTVDGQRRVSITGVVAGEPRAVYDDLVSRLADAGFAVEGESFQETDGELFATISATGDEGQAAVTLAGTADELTASVFLGLAG